MNLPEGAHIMEHHTAHTKIAMANGKRYHFCPMCNDWFDGDLLVTSERSIEILAGRTGTAYYCRNGHELGFFGAYH